MKNRKFFLIIIMMMNNKVKRERERNRRKCNNIRNDSISRKNFINDVTDVQAGIPKGKDVENSRTNAGQSIND